MVTIMASGESGGVTPWLADPRSDSGGGERDVEVAIVSFVLPLVPGVTARLSDPGVVGLEDEGCDGGFGGKELGNGGLRSRMVDFGSLVVDPDLCVRVLGAVRRVEREEEGNECVECEALEFV